MSEINIDAALGAGQGTLDRTTAGPDAWRALPDPLPARDTEPAHSR